MPQFRYWLENGYVNFIVLHSAEAWTGPVIDFAISPVFLFSYQYNFWLFMIECGEFIGKRDAKRSIGVDDFTSGGLVKRRTPFLLIPVRYVRMCNGGFPIIPHKRDLLPERVYAVACVDWTELIALAHKLVKTPMSSSVSHINSL